MAFRVPAYRVELVRTHTVVSDYRFCSGPWEAVELFTRAVGDPDREHLVAMYLDAKMRFVGIHVAAVGQIAEMQIAPAEVFKAALLCMRPRSSSRTTIRRGIRSPANRM